MKSYQKIKPVRDKAYLKWLTTKLCYICGCYHRGDEQTVAAHQTIPELKHISVKGTGQKDHDNHALPAHATEHIEYEHRHGHKPDNLLQRAFVLNIEYLILYKPELFKKAQAHWKKRKNLAETMEFITLSWMGDI